MDCFECIYYPRTYNLFDTNHLAGFIISLFLTATAPRVRRIRNLMGTSVRNGIRFVLLFGKKKCFIEKLSSLTENLFANVFPTPIFKK